MTNLTETSNWDAGVYQFAITDPIQGGPGGIDNQPHQALVDRTLWLRNRIAAAIIQSGQADGTADNQQLVEAVVLQVATVAALRAVPVPLVPGGATVLVLTRGQAAESDGLAATYKWSSASTAADNGTSIVTPSTMPASGRWLVCGINASALGGQAASYYATAATVALAVAPLAPLFSPTFTGDPQAPTPPAGDSSERLATTAWVGAEFLSSAGIALVWNGTGGTYYKIATLPASSTTTADSITIKATLNAASLAANDTMLEGIFGNRGGFRYVYNLFGPNTAGPAIVCYAETDGTTSVYALCTAAVGFVTLTILNSGVAGTSTSATLYATPASTTAPTGTLIFNSASPATYPPALNASSSALTVDGALMASAALVASQAAATLASAQAYAAAQASAAVTTAEAFTTAALAAYVRASTLTTDLALKANLDSPAFSGTPAAPTPASTDDSTRLATTAFVKLLAGITGVQAVNGGANFPNGLQLRWGTVNHSVGGNQAHSFSTQFDTGCFVVLPVVASSTGVEFFSVVAGSETASGWTQYANNTTSINYIAVGN